VAESGRYAGLSIAGLSYPWRQSEKFLQIGDSFSVGLNLFSALVTLLQLPPQVRQVSSRDMPINNSTLLASNEIMVGVLFPLVRFLADIERPFRIADGLLRKGFQNVAAAPVLLFEEAANGIVLFHYFHIIIVTM